MKLRKILLGALLMGGAMLTATSCAKSAVQDTSSVTTSETVKPTTPSPVTPSESEEPAPDPMSEDETKITVHYDLNGGSTASDTADIEVTGLSSSCFMYDLVKEGYNFRGWSYEGTLVYDQFGVCQNTVELKEEMTFKAEFSDKAILSIKSSTVGAGTVSGSGEYKYESLVDLHAEALDGYTFQGWSYDGNILSVKEDYKFKMWDRDVTIVAVFAAKYYNLTVESDSALAGYVRINTGDATGTYGETDTKAEPYKGEVTVSAYTLGDKRFMGWFDTETGEEITHNAVYTFRMPMNDYKLTAKWESYELSFESNGGGDFENIMTAKMPAIDTLPTPSKEGYKFEGWYLDEAFTKVPVEGEYLTADTALFAKWSKYYTLTYVTNGGTSISSETLLSLPESFPSPTKSGYSFQGWYTDEALTTKVKAGGTMTGDVTLYAKWYNRSSYTLSDDGIYFGAYPQSDVTDEKKISELNTLAGTLPTGADSLGKWSDYNYYCQNTTQHFIYYIDIDENSDGYNDYRGVYFTSYTSRYATGSSAAAQEDNGYTTGTVYWFSYDPILWDKIATNGKAGAITSYVLAADMIIDRSCFYTTDTKVTTTRNGGTGYSSNYELSTVRAWLNSTFLTTSFVSAEKSFVRSVTTSNVADTANNCTSTYICNDTTDYAWLFSYKDVNTTYYSSDADRICKPTSYVKCLGLGVETNGASTYWLRSPASAYYVCYVNTSGVGTNNTYADEYKGVRPCISIKA